jgi:hypothetical protein
MVRALNSSDLFRVGGVMTTSINSTQQWDLPNAWAPLQSIIIDGLGFVNSPLSSDLKHTLQCRWLNNMLLAYNATGMCGREREREGRRERNKMECLLAIPFFLLSETIMPTQTQPVLLNRVYAGKVQRSGARDHGWRRRVCAADGLWLDQRCSLQYPRRHWGQVRRSVQPVNGVKASGEYLYIYGRSCVGGREKGGHTALQRRRIYTCVWLCVSCRRICHGICRVAPRVALDVELGVTLVAKSCLRPNQVQ